MRWIRNRNKMWVYYERGSIHMRAHQEIGGIHAHAFALTFVLAAVYCVCSSCCDELERMIEHFGHRVRDGCTTGMYYIPQHRPLPIMACFDLLNHIVQNVPGYNDTDTSVPVQRRPNVSLILLHDRQDSRGFGIELCFTLHPCIVLLVPNVFLCAA